MPISPFFFSSALAAVTRLLSEAAPVAPPFLELLLLLDVAPPHDKLPAVAPPALRSITDELFLSATPLDAETAAPNEAGVVLDRLTVVVAPRQCSPNPVRRRSRTHTDS